MVTSLDMTRGVLATTPSRWMTLVDTVPEGLLLRQPLPGEWSAADCLRHMLTVERDLLGVRLRHILEGRPKLVPYDPDATRGPIPELSPRDMLAAFVASRQETEKIVAGLKPEDLDRSSFHPEYSVDISLGNLLDLWAAHDLQHTIQAERAMMQAFIPNTGPWRPEFADHDVEARG